MSDDDLFFNHASRSNFPRRAAGGGNLPDGNELVHFSGFAFPLIFGCNETIHALLHPPDSTPGDLPAKPIFRSGCERRGLFVFVNTAAAGPVTAGVAGERRLRITAF